MPETALTAVVDPAVDPAAAATSSGAAATPVTAVTTDPAVADPAAPASPAAPAVSAVPDTYDLKLPEGSTLDPAIVERTAATARALGLSNEAGQTLLDQTVQDETARATALQEQQQAIADSWKPGGSEWTKRNDQWTAESKADPELGKTPQEFATSIEKAQQALAKFGPEFKSVLDETGFGSHPAVIKAFARIGKAMSEPAFVPGTSGPAPRKKSDAEIMHPSHFNDDGTPKVV